MIIAHRNPTYHARRAAIWAVLAAAPWASFAFAADMADLGRGWGGAALVSPIALAFAGKNLWMAVAGRTPAVWTDGDVIVSDRFRRPLSDLISVRLELGRAPYGIWEEQFIVFEFSDGLAMRMLANRLVEAPDDIMQAVPLSNPDDRSRA